MAITITYPLGTPEVTLTLPGSNWGEDSGFNFADDINRTLDGTMNAYRAYKKRFKVLAWEYLTLTQKNALETLFAWGGAFTFADTVDVANQFNAQMVEAPAFKQEAYGYWAGGVRIEEI
jgi:hypothetical protein